MWQALAYWHKFTKRGKFETIELALTVIALLLKCLYQARKLSDLVHVYLQGYRLCQCFLDLSMRFWNRSESGACLVFHCIINVTLLFNKLRKRYIRSTTTSTFITSQAYELINVYLDNGPNFSHLRRHLRSRYIMYHTIRFEII